MEVDGWIGFTGKLKYLCNVALCGFFTSTCQALKAMREEDKMDFVSFRFSYICNKYIVGVSHCIVHVCVYACLLLV